MAGDSIFTEQDHVFFDCFYVMPLLKRGVRYNRTIPSASLICFEVSSTRTVFSMVHLVFQSPEGMTSACSGRWFMV